LEAKLIETDEAITMMQSNNAKIFFDLMVSLLNVFDLVIFYFASIALGKTPVV